MNSNSKTQLKSHNNFKTVLIKKLIENPNNPNCMSKPNFAKLVRNIERTGQYEPIIVKKKKTKFEIINGHSRVKALTQLGYKKVDICIWNIDDMQTDILSITLNRLSGTDILDKKLALLKRLSKESDAKHLSELLPFTSGQIDRYANLKLPNKPAKQKKDSFAEPLIFFVDKEQKKIIEQAIKKTTASGQTKSQAITKIAESFIKAQICHCEETED